MHTDKLSHFELVNESASYCHHLACRGVRTAITKKPKSKVERGQDESELADIDAISQIFNW
jgi:hypothetical protein